MRTVPILIDATCTSSLCTHVNPSPYALAGGCANCGQLVIGNFTVTHRAEDRHECPTCKVCAVYWKRDAEPAPTVAPYDPLPATVIHDLTKPDDPRPMTAKQPSVRPRKDTP